MSCLVSNDRRSCRRGRSACGWLGLEIAPRGLKLAVVEQSSGGLDVRGADRISWPDDANPTSLEEFGQLLTSTLRDWRRRHADLSVQQAACSLPEDWLRTAQLPLADRDADHASAQARELAARLSGLPADAAAWDYWVTPFQLDSVSGQPDSAGTLTICVAESEAVMVLDRALRRSGLELAAVDAAPLTTARAAAMSSPEPSLLVIAWDLDGLTLTWLSDGAPAFARRTSAVPLQRVMDELRPALELDEEGCRHLLSLYGLPGRDPAAGNLSRTVERLMSPVLDDLEHEIGRTLQFLEQRQSARRINTCLLMGDGAAIHGLAAELQARTGRRTRPWELGAAAELPFSEMELPAFADAIALSALAFSTPEGER